MYVSLHEFMCTTCMQVLVEARGHWIPWNWNYSKLSDVGTKSGPLQEQQVLLTAEPSSLRLHSNSFIHVLQLRSE